ncbi:hypothetical protein V6N11_045569 [Hibiscus sabdariffa]|uniref:Uncharacterized protein n=1 Tax=Hibiscus sabdariffa TaxID=183260 RepID=A0ABR2Q1D9_9ROSI
MRELKDCDIPSMIEELLNRDMQPDTTHTPGVAKATTSAIEAVPISFIHASSHDNVPIHPNLNQDNALPSQGNAQRTRKRRSRSALPDEFLENWVVSEKQRPNGRFDKALPWDNKADPSISTVPSTSVVLEGIPY